MTMETAIDQRLAVVEAALAEIQRRLPAVEAAPDWLDQVIGSFEDEPAFEEVLAYGRAFREDNRPSGNPEL